MKVSFPLSLKVSLWLLLNLGLLAAAGLALLSAQGGLGWDAPVRGPAGSRLQEVAATMTAEAAAAVDSAARDAVLARFGAAYGTDFFLFRNDGRQIAGTPVTLPAAVRAQLIPPGPRGRIGPEENEPEFHGPPDRANAAARGRLFVRMTAPRAYWIGWRVPYAASGGYRPQPATLFTRVDSRWALLRLLDLRPWLVAAAAVLAFSILLWLPFVHRVTRALVQLTAATGQIAEGRFDTRVPARRSDEIGALGRSVNRMARRLDDEAQGQKRFLGDVAHELSSPLARLQLAVEILEERADPGLRPQLADVREEAQLMSALVNELLAFTQAGLRHPSAALVPVDLSALANRIVAREDGAARTQVEIPAGLCALADAALLERAVGNLLRNALRYAGDAGPVRLRARRENAAIILTVADAGPGVPPAALERLGEPFFRPEAARTREGGGAGLGLAIVKSSVEACRGRVRFLNLAPRGFAAEIHLAAP